MAEFRDVGGVSFQLTGFARDLPDGRRANAVELTYESTWEAVRALKGHYVGGLGDVVDVGAPRLEKLPVGTKINLVTK